MSVVNVVNVLPADASKQYTLAYFTAGWCGPCKRISPVFEKLSSDSSYENVLFCKIDVDSCEDLCKQYEVSSMPTFILLKNGTQIERFSGANETNLIKMLDGCKNILNVEF